MKMANINLVNKHLETAFGKRFRGDVGYEGNHYDGIYFMRRSDSLKNIHKNTPLTRVSFFLFRHPENVGYFEDNDPTKMCVRKGYLKNAQEYARLYEEESNEKVIINELEKDSLWRVF